MADNLTFIEVTDPDLLFIFGELCSKSSMRKLKKSGLAKKSGNKLFFEENAYAELAMVALELKPLFGNSTPDEIKKEFQFKIS